MTSSERDLVELCALNQEKLELMYDSLRQCLFMFGQVYVAEGLEG